MIEYEAKVLDIDAGRVAALIRGKGGTDLGETLQRRYVYDIEPGDVSRWLRPRDTGRQVTLTVKEIEADGHAEVVRVAALLGYGEADLTGENTTKVYDRHGIDLSAITELRFDGR